jgi:hypothetical protein
VEDLKATDLKTCVVRVESKDRRLIGGTREIGDRRGASYELGHLSIIYDDLGEARRAIEFYEQA